jgi:CHASE3 domain sensor protein
MRGPACQLTHAAPHDEGHARIIERLEQQVDAMLTQLADTVELRKISGPGVVQQKFLSDRGENPMDNIRAMIGNSRTGRWLRSCKLVWR